MKLICNKADLLNGVNTVSKAVPNKTSMSILECILIDASSNEIKLIANDTELGIETTINGTIEEKGKIALDAKILTDYVRKLPDSQVSIECDSSLKTYIKCDKINFTLIGKPADEFTYLPKVEKLDSIVLSQFSLKEIIRQTIFSISDNDSNNKIMTGELFEVKGNNLRVISLDGHRVSIRKIELKNNYENKKVIVPGKTLNEIVKIIPGDTSKDVTIYFTGKHIMFEFERTIVVSRLIEGEYYNIDQMLSSDYETKIVVNKKELYDSIDRSMLLIKEGDKKPIIWNVTDNNVEVKINSIIGSLNEEIAIEKQGKDLMIGFNPKFLMDALRVIDDENISVYMVNPKAPCYIKNGEESYIYMVLPVNFTTVS
ncbi:MAG: DNA polymerase III subunit beta [Lachnospiraceae bacterium]|nr:DNA polymerase III subunit beta [Lachnospiraceae bacterium]